MVKITCNTCDATLVDADLNPVKQPQVSDTVTDDNGRELYSNLYIDEHSYMYDHIITISGHEHDVVIVNPAVITDEIIPEFDDNVHGGCCNHDRLDVKCGCDSIVGLAHLDCWQTRGVRLFRDNVSIDT